MSAQTSTTMQQWAELQLIQQAAVNAARRTTDEIVSDLALLIASLTGIVAQVVEAAAAGCVVDRSVPETPAPTEPGDKT